MSPGHAPSPWEASGCVEQNKGVEVPRQDLGAWCPVQGIPWVPCNLADAFSPPSGCTSLPRLVASFKSSIKQPWNVWGTAARRGGQGRPASLWKHQRINGTFLLSHLLPVLCWGPHIVTGMYWGSKHPGTCMSVGWLSKELGRASPPAGLRTPQICPKSQEDAGKCSPRTRVGLAGI